jgi:hypothetical protein
MTVNQSLAQKNKGALPKDILRANENEDKAWDEVDWDALIT